ncbi:MAG: exodeoxyribonuclease VII large subunit, partial [Candidatus Baltobacteraceae bacterium]
LEGAVAHRLTALQKGVVQRERALIALDPRARLVGRAAAIATRSEQLHASAAALLRRLHTQLDTRGERVPERIAGLAARKRSMLDLRTAALRGADPHAPLGRGYAMVLREGVVVRNASQLQIGDEVRARFGRGAARARIERIEPEESEA